MGDTTKRLHASMYAEKPDPTKLRARAEAVLWAGRNTNQSEVEEFVHVLLSYIDCQAELADIKKNPIPLAVLDQIARQQEEINNLTADIKTKDERIKELEENQFPSEPTCKECGKPRKSLGILWENHLKPCKGRKKCQ